jgi:hypothetical protein
MSTTQAPSESLAPQQQADSAIPRKELLSQRGALLLGTYFLVLLPLLCWALYRIIALIKDVGGHPTLQAGDMLLAAIVAGALGSYVHAVTSFATYRGNRQLYSSWVWWYTLRPFVGVAMALLFYFAARGGVLVMSGGTTVVDPYAVLIVCGLAGMFSKQASDKLAEVFDTLLGSTTAGERKDKLQVAVVRVTALQPPKTRQGSGLAALVLVGESFVSGSTVTFAGKPREARFVNPSRLEVTLEPADTARTGRFAVVVTNPAPSAGSSEPVSFEVVAAGDDDPDSGASPEKPVVGMSGIPIKAPDGGAGAPG